MHEFNALLLGAKPAGKLRASQRVDTHFPDRGPGFSIQALFFARFLTRIIHEGS
jgi:hypothetical protein